MNKLDLLGNQYGDLTVISPAEDDVLENGRHFTKWLCQCACGNEVAVRTKNLVSGRTKSCGCKSRCGKLGHLFNDLTGQRFGRLLVLERAPDRISKVDGKRKRTNWKCQCDCGNIVNVDGSH